MVRPLYDNYEKVGMIEIADATMYADKEAQYIAVRDAEQRVVSDELLKELPNTPEDYALHSEWQIRVDSTKRLMKWFAGSEQNILDLGCGNGWMSNMLYKAGHKVTGVDLNLTELRQAEKVFGANNRLEWVYADVLQHDIPNAPFDSIVLAASCQYFDDMAVLTDRLKTMLSDKGAIHLVDSFFYTEKNVAAAKQRTRDYYTKVSYPEMSEYYYHHQISDLKKLGYKKKYPTLFSGGNKPEWWILKL